ncbi:MAG TPA: GNAT family N-acetyltransferase [Paracoccaceae bacterium]|nr:GNAT family N-acetyltransferase [Paracoccaceae bacterium]
MTVLADPILTERMELRPLRTSDAGPISLFAGDVRVARMTTAIPHPYPPGAAEAFIEAALSGRRNERVWVLDGTRSGGSELIGLISARPREGGEFEIGYWVGPPFWNTGYASEALAALIRPLFAEGARRLTASVFQDNPVSAHVIERAGFARIGRGELHSVARGGMVPTWTYALDRPLRG